MAKNKDVKLAFQGPADLLSDALTSMNQTGFRAVLVVDDAEKLLGLVTDWDIRNAILRGRTLDTPLSAIMNPKPVVGFSFQDRNEHFSLMMAHKNECLPVVDQDHRVVDFVLLTDFVQDETARKMNCAMVIMAGGEGKRLWPLTKDVPKPLLPVASRPLLAHILDHIQTQGFEDVRVSTHYKAEKIEDFLKTSTPAGVITRILKEETPLGTAGCLKQLADEESIHPVFVMNGDILTTVNFESMYQWHLTHGNMLTLACRQHIQNVPYGVLETNGQQLASLQEKPQFCYNINAGIYLIEPEVLNLIPENVHFDITDLIEVMLSQGLQVGTYPLSESWIDIGKHEDYKKANEEFEQYSPAGIS